MEFDFGAYNAVAIAIVMVLVGVAKGYVTDRYIPLLPLVFGFLIGILMYFAGLLEITEDASIAGQIVWNGFLYAVISATLFKTYKTTLKGK